MLDKKKNDISMDIVYFFTNIFLFFWFLLDVEPEKERGLDWRANDEDWPNIHA